MNSLRTALISLFFISYSFISAQDNEARLLRFPDISNGNIVFSYAGDLYLVSENGGMARKLTTHEGYEMFARFSPDGKQIAFTGQYDGNTEVFLIPSQGGEPKRLTYTATLKRDDISDRMGPNNIVMEWTPDGKNIIYRSRKQSFNAFVGQLFKVPVSGGLSAGLPLPTGGFCSFSEDGGKMAYNRVFREFRTWKYYKGGMADDVWIYDFSTKETVNITSNDAQDIFPMWHKDEIYFLSDRDRIMNMFVYNLKTKETRKVTEFTEYDIKFPSIGGDKIVFENGGYIYSYDIATGKNQKLVISIADDMLAGRDEWKDASKFIRDYDLSPDGSRLLLSARGDIFTVPCKSGFTRNLTHSSGTHDREAVWSPDGEYIAYLSDASGEYEIYLQKQDGSEAPVQLTKNADTYKYSLKWSPDSKKLIWSDKKLRLLYVDIDTKAVVQVDQSDKWEFNGYDWSPDSKWIAYTLEQQGSMSVIMLYKLDSKKKFPVTDNWFESSRPTFSKDGKYLFFTSSRDFNPVYSATEWNHAYTEMDRIYLVTLAKETPSPLAPENDEVKLEKPVSDINPKSDDKKENTAAIVKIDTEGIGNRIVGLPVDPANYWGISALNDAVYYARMRKNENASLYVFDLKEKKETKIGDYGNSTISDDGKKIAMRVGNNFYVTDLPKGEYRAEKPVDLSGLTVKVNNKEEWKQIYNESWRQMRDFFYDPAMHGVDWNAMRDKYGVLVPYVSNRNDLNYLIGELIGELSCGHAYTGGGDKPEPERITTGLLGAKLSRDASGYYKIDKLLKGENWNTDMRSPLTEIGVDCIEGEFIIAIDGVSTKDMNDIYAALAGKDGKQVEMKFNSKASADGARTCIVVPIADESLLYYYNWVQDNIKKVSDATDGKVGYIHIPDMSVEGLNEFVKYFYPQMAKKALIIDDRGNGGGNVSPMIIERLRRELSLMGMSRDVPFGDPTPGQMHYGPKVLLLNNYSASDGDLFPYQFRQHKLGKLIGVRSWGGVVGIRGSLPFIDGGSLMKPEFAHYAADGSNFIIEGHGVDPDIVIDNDPAKEYAGEDQQLNKAIEVILEELEKWEKDYPVIPPFPDKSK
ncbi:MAG: PDZ domain-containing protein [Bacteroidota bacterium]